MRNTEKQKKSEVYIQEFFNKLATISDSEKGITRLAFTDKDWETRGLVQSYMKALGLTITEDAFGNYIGLWEGLDPDLPPVLMGSHMDSVPEGGNYDGPLGIIAGLDVIRRLQEAGVTLDHSLGVIVFMCEESSRFGGATLGSRALIGDLTQEDLLFYKDRQGITLREALIERNLPWQDIGNSLYTQAPKSFFEVHIEQGKVLEHEKKTIGVVSGIAAPTRYRIFLKGHADHSGATPMNLRLDALCGAAEIVLALEELAKSYAEPPVVGTIGVLEVKPGALNVIPGEVELGIDIRSIAADKKAEVSAQFLAEVERICRERGLSFETILLGDEQPVNIADDMQGMLAEICAAQGTPFMIMPSGAGHDAMFMAGITPTGMLFIPCRDGISHHVDEYSETSHMVKAVDVLEDMIRKVALKEFSW